MTPLNPRPDPFHAYGRALRVLLIQDDGDEARHVRDMLGCAPDLNVALTHVSSLGHADTVLADGGIDLILLDVRLPDGNACQWLLTRKPLCQAIPVVILSGIDDEPLVTAALAAGAEDSVAKSGGDPSSLARIIRHAVERRQFREQLQQTDRRFQHLREQLQQTDRRFRHLLENAIDLVAILDLEGAVVYASPVAEGLLGVRPELLIGSRLWDWVHVDDVLPMQEIFAAFRSDPRATRACEFRVLDTAGVWRTFEAVGWLLTDGTMPEVLINARDVSGRRRAESALQQREHELQQAQKLEAIGRVAGGVAHDFSNVLTVIIGATERLLDHLPNSTPLRAEAESIQHAAERAAHLTLQLLTFSRRQAVAPTSLMVADVLAGIGRFLRPLIGEDIVLVTNVAQDVGTIRADRTQLEQVLLNLAINARDAMPMGGRLTIHVTATTLAEPQLVGGILLTAGPYVLMRVEDTGIGMDEQTQAQAFEPFFTTKGPDKGTGLGLATVYGIVSQNGGAVALDSRIGVGTVVSVYFPHTTEAEATEPDLPARSQAPGGSETVLIVEDENEVRELVRDMLASAGYTVLEAPLPHLAVDICRTYRGTIHLLLTDVVMPEASGREVAASVQAMRPAIKVLFMSGYPEYPGERGAPRIDGANLLSKPFDRQGLLGRIRHVLEGSPVSGAGSDV